MMLCITSYGTEWKSYCRKWKQKTIHGNIQ